jgi:predicted HTH transcriptional regulator
MIARTLSSITAADVQQLVTDRTTEGRTIEFKRDLPGPKESDRKEFLADVSSFANAVGGDLIFGVEERDGRAIAAEGLTLSSLTQTVSRETDHEPGHQNLPERRVMGHT